MATATPLTPIITPATYFTRNGSVFKNRARAGTPCHERCIGIQDRGHAAGNRELAPGDQAEWGQINQHTHDKTVAPERQLMGKETEVMVNHAHKQIAWDQTQTDQPDRRGRCSGQLQ